MKIAAVKETFKGETRTVITPETAKKFIGLGFDVVVETEAGVASGFMDSDYTDVGAIVKNGFGDTINGADVIIKINPPNDEEIKQISEGQVLISSLNVLNDKEILGKLAEQKVNAFALEMIPRISRAQNMDILSSQSNLAGYKAVIMAADKFGKAMPMLMTSAGTITPARVLIMGVGVAGLQAIATAKRLGAVVYATDVRAATKEQVESLGGKFVEVKSDNDSETAGGYAKEMDEDYKRRQAEAVAEQVKKSDIIITTALIPGKKAPVLITEEMVKTMKAGSVIVDLAASMGGNCELTQQDEITVKHNVNIIGLNNLLTLLPQEASNMFARNVLNFLSPHVDKETKELKINYEDEIISSTNVVRDGNVLINKE